jgi:tripartite-type tricarboxylate transporter receptor subunit TctC
MMLNRRNILALSGAALAAGLIPAGRTLAADIKSLLLVEPMGKPFMTRTAFELLIPKLKQEMNCAVGVQTIPGHDGYDAIHAILGSTADAPQLWSGAIMATQLAARIFKEETRLEDLTPIVKLTSGFSVTLFTKRGGPLKSWSDIAALKPLKVSSLMRATAAYLGVLMLDREGHLATDVSMHDLIPDVVADVMSGRSAAGIIATMYVAQRLDHLQPIVSFGAQRNAMLSQTPTLAEIMGNPKLAFTESFGVFGPPKLDPALAERLVKGFISAGQDQDVIDGAEAAGLPLAISGPEVLVDNLKRNENVLNRILG